MYQGDRLTGLGANWKTKIRDIRYRYLLLVVSALHQHKSNRKSYVCVGRSQGKACLTLPQLLCGAAYTVRERCCMEGEYCSGTALPTSSMIEY